MSRTPALANRWLVVRDRDGAMAALPNPIRLTGSVNRARRHTWPRTIPSSRFGRSPSEPIELTPSEPSLVGVLDVLLGERRMAQREQERLPDFSQDGTKRGQGRSSLAENRP